MNTDSLETKLLARRRTLGVLYDVLDPTIENLDYDTGSLAELAEITPSQIGNYLHELEQLGIISRRYEYGSNANGMTTGRHFHMRFRLSPEDAFAVLTADDEARRTKRDETFQKLLTMPRPKKPRKAKATPPTKLRVVETGETGIGPGAIVDLARKYRDSTGVITAKLNELQALADEIGTPLDMDLMREALGVNTALDPRLEAICEVLPYIEALERKVEAMTEMLNAATTKIAQG